MESAPQSNQSKSSSAPALPFHTSISVNVAPWVGRFLYEEKRRIRDVDDQFNGFVNATRDNGYHFHWQSPSTLTSFSSHLGLVHG